jgi:hypothetical protein
VIDTRMATSSMSNNAFSQHGRDDHAPLFALPRARSSQGRDGAPPPSDLRGNAAFASRNGAHAPETWDPDGAASLPFFTKGAAAPTPARQRELKP